MRFVKNTMDRKFVVILKINQEWAMLIIFV